MVVRQRLVAMFIGAAVVWLPGSTGAQGGSRFNVRLFRAPVGGSDSAAITGAGTATAELTGTRLSIAGTFEGLRFPATRAQLHRGVAKVVRGPVLFDLTIAKATSGTVGGSVELTPGQIEDLRKGRLYVQIDGEKSPEGNLVGWLLP